MNNGVCSYGWCSGDYLKVPNNTPHHASNDCVHFIMEHEGFSSTPYRDIAGNWTIGYGHLIKSGEYFTSTVISLDEIEALVNGLGSWYSAEQIAISNYEAF